MKMSNLVDITYRSLVARLQRYGTNVTLRKKPSLEAYCWTFDVAKDYPDPGVFLTVEVGILTKNVRRNDKIVVRVNGMSGGLPGREFISFKDVTPSLDYVEGFIRFSLDAKSMSRDQDRVVVEQPIEQPAEAGAHDRAMEFEVMPKLEQVELSPAEVTEPIVEEPVRPRKSRRNHDKNDFGYGNQ